MHTLIISGLKKCRKIFPLGTDSNNGNALKEQGCEVLCLCVYK
jgi:hypothetical protein